MFDDLTVCTPLPRYLPFPKFLLDAQLSHTAKLLYALLLDRATLSRKNNWTDEQDRIYVIYPIPKLAQALGCSFSSVTRSLTELTDAGLIERTRSGFSKLSRIFLKIPHTAQKCAATLRISGSSDCAEMTNMIVQKCPPNYLNSLNEYAPDKRRTAMTETVKSLDYTKNILRTIPNNDKTEVVTQTNAVKSPTDSLKATTLVYTVEEIAQMLSISLRSAYNLCNSTTEFRVLRVGGSIRIPKDSFDAWLRAA